MAVAAKVWRSYVPRPEKLIIIVASRIFPAYANTYERGVCIAIRVAAATARPPRNSLEHTSPFRVNQPSTIPRGLSTPLSRTRERGDTLRTRAPTNALSDHTNQRERARGAAPLSSIWLWWSWTNTFRGTPREICATIEWKPLRPFELRWEGSRGVFASFVIFIPYIDRQTRVFKDDSWNFFSTISPFRTEIAISRNLDRRCRWRLFALVHLPPFSTICNPVQRRRA